MMFTPNFLRSAAVISALLMSGDMAYAHVTIQPKESTAGVSVTYTMRVPTEKFVPTVRVEVEFPSTLNVSAFDAKSGWKIESNKDAAGKLRSASLTGSIPPGESALFTFTATNPSEATKLSWKVVQIYEDGSKSEWTGGEGSRTPAPTVQIRK